MTIGEFERRLAFNGGADRQFGDWQMLDIHQAPESFSAQHEIDFYCYNGRAVYLLRLRNITQRNLVIVDEQKSNYPPYLIAELPITKIDNEFLQAVLAEFNL